MIRPRSGSHHGSNLFGGPALLIGVADDIVSSGSQSPGRDKAIASLFEACYPQLVRTAFGLAGDWALAGDLVQEAFVRLCRRWRWFRDPAAAPAYLQRTVVSLAHSAGRRHVPEPRVAAAGAEEAAGPGPAADISEQELRGLLQAKSDGQNEVDRAWHQFQRRRRESGRRRGRRLAMAAAAAVAIGAAITLALAGHMQSTPGNAPPSGRAAPGSHRRARPAASAYPGAITARIPVRNVISMAGNGSDVWAMTLSGELVRIDARTNKVTVRAHVAGHAYSTELVSGGGALWLDACLPPGQARLLRIDTATGGVLSRTRLPGGCGSAAYGLGHLWAVSGVRHGIRILRIDPATGMVDARTGTLHNLVDSFVAGPEGVWYGAGSTVRQVSPAGTRLSGVTVNSSGYPFTLNDADLALGQGALWALSGDENVARIDPVTGRITQVVSYRTFDPAYSFQGGLFLQAGQDSLWLLADLGGHTQVLLVSMSTGRPLGLVNAGGSCGRSCGQFYNALGAVWVPLATEIVRIDPARLAG